MIAAVTIAFALLTQTPDATRPAGDQILSAGQAGGIFQNLSDGDVIRLKHPASGMICHFRPAASRNNIRIYPVRPGVNARGDDVGCGTTENIAYTIYATRYQPAANEEAAMTQAIEEVEAIWGDVQRLDIEIPAAAANGPSTGSRTAWKSPSRRRRGGRASARAATAAQRSGPTRRS